MRKWCLGSCATAELKSLVICSLKKNEWKSIVFVVVAMSQDQARSVLVPAATQLQAHGHYCLDDGQSLIACAMSFYFPKKRKPEALWNDLQGGKPGFTSSYGDAQL